MFVCVPIAEEENTSEGFEDEDKLSTFSDTEYSKQVINLLVWGSKPPRSKPPGHVQGQVG